VSEATVLAQADIGAQGISLAEFTRVASLHRLEGAWYHVESSRLRGLPTPFVAHLAEDDGGHYVAVVAHSHDTVVVVDPAAGVLVGPSATLLRRYSGRAYVLTGGTP
jgi:ABC-type bacteriocin/lantibiotic exporter with double-glycine peptidase domain